MKTDLIGVWSYDALYGPSVMEDSILTFRAGGTGLVEWMNLGFHDIEFFDWTLTPSGQVKLKSQKRFRLDDTSQKYLEVERTFQVVELPFHLKEVETFLDGIVPLLELQSDAWPGGMYGLIQEDADARPIPQMSA